MATKELPINVDQDGIPQSFSKNFDQTGNSSGFIFDVTLSTAIAANGKSEAKSPNAQGAAFARDARQDESLLARGKLSVHRPDLPV